MAVHDESLDDAHDPWLSALARTPPVKPFRGTDRYRVVSCIGEGGFGVVYEVEDRELGRQLALKTLKPQRAGFAANIQRLKREFRSVADLVHPNLVGLHELSSDGARWFFTMDLIRGSDLIASVRGDAARIRPAFGQLAAGVAALHDAGIVHRDLKPPNVLVEPGGRVVILDFGLADRDADPDLASAGTPVYMAPEGATSPAADWYAVGVMLYEALTGRLPFDGPRGGREPVPPSNLARVPADLERLCLALLRPDPADRPAAPAIAAQLGDALALAADARHPDPRGSFVGRSAELTTLRRAHAAGKPAVIRVHGQPGVGKSTLLARFADEIRDTGTVVLAGRCHERESVPFKAFDGVVDALVRHLQTLPRAEASGLMPRDAHLIAQLFPVLDAVDALRDVPRRAPIEDPRMIRDRAFAAIKELLGRLADKQPLVIVVDDLQWGDHDSARLLASLVAPPDRPAAVLVLCYRSDDAAQNPSLRDTLQLLASVDAGGIDLPVDPLPVEDAERLARLLLGVGVSVGDPDAAHAIAQRCEGHPLFMAELARAHRSAAVGPPPTLIDILWERIVRLSATARRLLETVCVAGQPRPSSLCFEAAGLGGAGVEAMRVLRAEQLVRAGDHGEINVFHDRIRDAVLMRTDARDRGERHLALARCLERAPGADPEALARHFDAADEGELAARYAVRAAEAASAALAFDRAAALYRLAIDRAGGSAALYEALGDALDRSGSTARAGEAYREAAARADGMHAIELRRRVAVNLCIGGDYDAGCLAATQLLAEIGETLPPTYRRSGLEGIYHLTRMRLGGFRFRERREAAISSERLLHLDVLESLATGLGYLSVARAFGLMMRYSRQALRTGEPRRAGRGLVMACLGLVAAHQSSRMARIDELLDQAEAIARRLDDPSLMAMAYRMRADSLFMHGELRAARPLLEQGAAMLAEQCIGMGPDRRMMQMFAAKIDLLTGELEQARRNAETLLVDAVQREDPVAEHAVTVGVLAPLALADDDPDAAVEYLARARLEDRCGILVFRAESSAWIATYRGRTRDAVDAWRARWPAIECEQALTAPAFRVMAVRSFGIALLASARDRSEVREARRFARKIRSWRGAYARAVTATIDAYVALRADRDELAAERFADAARWYDDAAMPLDAWACRHRRGRLIGGDAGDTEVATAVAALRARRVVDPVRWIAMTLPELEPAQLP